MPYNTIQFMFSKLLLLLCLFIVSLSIMECSDRSDSKRKFIISNISGNTTEGGETATFTVKLNEQPDRNVVIDVASSDSTEGKVSPSRLTFTSSDYAFNQTVTVTGVDDSLEDGNIVYTVQLSISSGLTTDTTGYASLSPKGVSVINIDDEAPSFTISDISGDTTEEGGTAVFTVKLHTEPDGNVVIDVETDDNSEGKVSPSRLTFTSSNYATNQTVTVTGVDDSLEDGNIAYTVQLSINSGLTADTTGYTSLDPNDVSVINIDDETPGFTISDISGDTTEGGKTATFTVKPYTKPDGNVVIDVETSDSTEGTVSPSRLTFTPSNYDSSQTVTVTGVDDSLEDGNIAYTIQLSINSGLTTDTTGYASLDPNDVSVINESTTNTLTPTAYYTFDNETLEDSVGAKTGTNNGGEYDTGKVGKSIKFNNSGSTNNYGSLEDITIDNLTVSFWVKYDSANKGNDLGSLYSIGSDGNEFFGIRIHNDVNGLVAAGFNFNGTPYSTTTTWSTSDAIDISDGEWHMITVTSDQSTLKIYHNGSLFGDPATIISYSFTGAKQYIAAHGWANNTMFDARFSGWIDELRIYETVLSETEISQIYENEK